MSIGMMIKRAPQGTGGVYTCPDGGARKSQLDAAGANAKDKSISQLETGCDGKPYPAFDNKKGDSANCGPYKNNWYAIRTHCCDLDPQLCGGPANYTNCAMLNDNDKLATDCQHAQQTAMGDDKWACIQRGGTSCTQKDIDDYNTAVNYIQGTGVNGGAEGGKPDPKNPGEGNSTNADPEPKTPGEGNPSTTNPDPKNPGQGNPSAVQGGTDIYGSDVCGYGGGQFRGCKTQGEMCAHIKTNGQPLPSECGGSNDSDNANPAPKTPVEDKSGGSQGGTDIYGSDVCGYGGGPFRGCKTQEEMCAHIKTNGQPLPSECSGSNGQTDNKDPSANKAKPDPSAQPATNDEPKDQPQSATNPPNLKSFKATTEDQSSADPKLPAERPTDQNAADPKPADPKPAAGQPAAKGRKLAETAQPAADPKPADQKPAAGGNDAQAAYYNLPPQKRDAAPEQRDPFEQWVKGNWERFLSRF